jgi:hypothetical protein
MYFRKAETCTYLSALNEIWTKEEQIFTWKCAFLGLELYFSFLNKTFKTP